MREGLRINNTLKVFVKVKERITLFYICLKSQIIYICMYIHVYMYIHSYMCIYNLNRFERIMFTNRTIDYQKKKFSTRQEKSRFELLVRGVKETFQTM